MKIRLAAFAVMAVLAGCSEQNSMETGKLKAVSQDSAGYGKQAVSILTTISREPSQSIGNAPDRGELFTYQKAGVKQEGAYTMRPVQLSEEHALRGVVTGLLTVPAPSGGEIKIRYERHEENPDGNWSWIGRVVGGDAAQEAIFTFGEKAVFASIPQATGPALRITTQKGITYLVQADPSKLFKSKRAGADTKVASSNSVAGALDSNDPLATMAMAKARTASAADVTEKSITAGNTVDLVAGYSQGLATVLGSDSAAVTRLNALVTSANQALLNSKVNARIRLVFALKVAYADNTDNGAALEQLTGTNGNNPVTVPAALAPLRTARDTYGADLVTLVRDLQAVNNGCGIAWLVGANGEPITTAGDAPFGYSVVSDGDYNLNGNTYFCDDTTLAHELAHNMGSAHDVGNALDDNGILVPGRYPYSYGYKTSAAAGNFFTVMAYGDNNQTLYRVFSNPNITSCGGLACGVANAADNARSLGQTVPTISQFRATKVPLVGSARNDVDGDGRSDVLLHNATTRQFSYRIANGTAVTRSQLINNVGPGYTVAATGDFNGDGRADLIWTSSNLDLYMWVGNGTTFASTKVGVYPAGWKVVGAGDVDGDGRSDILFHNATTRQLSYRIMNGTATVRSSLINGVGAGYTVGAIGDMNGDGKADLVWTSSSLDLYLWTGNGTTFTSAAIGTYPSGWKLVGAGDIDADGKSDLILHNATARQLSYRIMSGGTTTRSALIGGVGAGYTVGTTGDFNGDGKTDLVWTSGNLDLYMWIGNGTGFTSTKFGVYPSGWKVVY